MKNLFYLLLILSITGCNEYWWTRGQPPSVKDLINRASTRFAESPKTRIDFFPSADKLKTSLLASLDSKNNEKLLQDLQEIESQFLSLEGKISIGSRAAYGELSNQLRAFIGIAKSDKQIDQSAYGLFASRTIFFLASELTVPAPSF